jgi:hypothetical protein
LLGKAEDTANTSVYRSDNRSATPNGRTSSGKNVNKSKIRINKGSAGDFDRDERARSESFLKKFSKNG